MILGDCKWYANKISKEIQEAIQKGVPPIGKGFFDTIFYYLFVSEVLKGDFNLERNVRLVSAQEIIDSVA